MAHISGVTNGAGRRPKPAVVEENAAKLAFFAERRVEPAFPESRAVWGDIHLFSSANHMNPNVLSRMAFASHLLAEIADAAGVSRSKIANLAYDNAVASTDTPAGHTMELGAVRPRVLNGDLPYSKQTEFKTFDINDTAERLVSIYGFSGRTPEIDDMVSILNTFQRNVHKRTHDFVETCQAADVSAKYLIITPYLKIPPHVQEERYSFVPEELLQMRARQMSLIDVQDGPSRFIPEIMFTSFMSRLADSLEALDTAGKPFYKMPINPEVFPPPKDSNGNAIGITHLKGINAKGKRVPVKMEMHGFTFEEMPGNWVFIPTSNIYDEFRKGTLSRLVPTVPVVMLGMTTGPQIPHIGGAAWKIYALDEISRQLEWLGVPHPAEAANALYLTTYGQEAFGVSYTETKKRSSGEYTTEEKTLNSLFISYITLGKEALVEALRTGEYVEGTYGVRRE